MEQPTNDSRERERITKLRRLPTRLDDLRGLRMARYRRESREDQGEKYGPAAQDSEIDHSRERWGLVDGGLVYADLHSGFKQSDQRPEFQAMLRDAGHGAFDVLVVAYFSRFSRNLEQALFARTTLHRSGVAIAFADEEFLSSNDDDWERFVEEAVAAEEYSRRLSRTVRKSYRAKFDRHQDQAGDAPLGFLRTPQPAALLEVDPEAIKIVQAMFKAYAGGDVSDYDLGLRFGYPETRIRSVLLNPIYNGWVRWHQRREDRVTVEAPWRHNDDGVMDSQHPPVSDDLWARVAEVRQRRLATAGRRRPHRFYLLSKHVWCTCGHGVRASARVKRSGREVRVYMHPHCERWPQASYQADAIEATIAAQVGQIRFGPEMRARLRALAAVQKVPDQGLRRRQLQRELQEKTGLFLKDEITLESLGAEKARITGLLADLERPAQVTTAAVAPAPAIARWLRDNLAHPWRLASDQARAKVVAAIYDRIVMENGRIVGVELTTEAKQHGLMLGIPEAVVLARPAGLEPTTSRSATWRSIH